jgi:uncharacterized membrane protein SpoIIM required for sporulation
MKETRFIGQNKEKWAELEQMLRSNERNPDALSDLFVQVTDDLSYARSHYPNRVVRIYLNQLSQQVFGRLQQNTNSQLRLFIRFWKSELPMALFQSRKALLWSFILFFVSFLVGIFSSAYAPDFAESILGSGYIAMTERNIEAGNPTAVYQESSALEMFFYIARNNISIALRTFLFGLLFAIGTLGVMLYNGVMVGTFQYLFVGKGVLLQSILGIWMHGTFEISAIILSGGAGFVLGSGLVFPGTYTRMQALRRSARNGIRILILAVVMLLIAAIIESWVTRLVSMPDYFRIGLIASMLALVVFYVIVYPIRVAKGGGLLPQDGELQAIKPFSPDLQELKTGSQLFGNSFGAFFSLLPSMAGKLLLLCIPAVVAYCLMENNIWNLQFPFYRLRVFLETSSQAAFGLWFVPSTVLCLYWVMQTWNTRFSSDRTRKNMLKRSAVAGLLFGLAWPLLTFFNSVWVLILTLPFISFVISTLLLSKQPIRQSLGEAITLIREGFLHLTGLYISLMVLSGLSLLLAGFLPELLNVEMVEMLFNWDDSVYTYYRKALGATLQLMVLLLVVMLFACSNILVWYNLHERLSAAALKRKLQDYGLADAD